MKKVILIIAAFAIIGGSAYAYNQISNNPCCCDQCTCTDCGCTEDACNCDSSCQSACCVESAECCSK